MDEVLEKEYGNPSSMHMKGFDAEKYVNHAKKRRLCKEPES